jgi:FO synthase
MELAHRTAAAGFTLRPRLPIYPEYISRAERFIAPELIPYVERLCGEDGLVAVGGYHEPHRSDVRL